MSNPPILDPRVGPRLEVDADCDEFMRLAGQEGAREMLTRDHLAVAVLMSWSDDIVLHERLGRFEVAHWAAWTAAGRFDVDRLRQAVADLVEEFRLLLHRAAHARRTSADTAPGDA